MAEYNAGHKANNLSDTSCMKNNKIWFNNFLPYKTTYFIFIFKKHNPGRR